MIKTLLLAPSAMHLKSNSLRLTETVSERRSGQLYREKVRNTFGLLYRLQAASYGV